MEFDTYAVAASAVAAASEMFSADFSTFWT